MDYDSQLSLEDKDRPTLKIGGITWDKGEKNKNNYHLGQIYNCIAGVDILFVPDDVFDMHQLKKVGKTEKGEHLFGFSNKNNDFFEYIIKHYHRELNEVYKGDSDDSIEKKKQGFFDELGVIFWQDPLGRWIKLTKEKYYARC